MKPLPVTVKKPLVPVLASPLGEIHVWVGGRCEGGRTSGKERR
jgi:hypothetical protein